jgi:hypothetical protein
MGKPKLTEQDFDRIAELRENGVMPDGRRATFKLIAAELDVSPSAISWHCLRLGAEPPTPGRLNPPGPRVMKRGKFEVRRFSPEEDRRLLELDAAGAKRSAIARELRRRSNSITGRLMTLARLEAREEAA